MTTNRMILIAIACIFTAAWLMGFSLPDGTEPGLPGNPTTETTTCTEDMDCWDCATMGNLICGPEYAEVTP